MRNRTIITRLSIILTTIVIGLSLPAAAQSFYEPNSEGDIIYYDVLTPNSVEVAWNPRHLFYKRVIRIPPQVVHNDTTYTVAGIGNMAFHDYENDIDSVILPNTIASIGRAAFSCNHSIHTIILPRNVVMIGFLSFLGTRMDTITILAETPPGVIRTELNTMTNIYPFIGTDLSSCILRVPAQSVQLYKHDPYWGRFKNIKAIHSEQPQTIVTHTSHESSKTHTSTTTQYQPTYLTFDSKTTNINYDDNIAQIAISYCNYDGHTLKAPYDIALYEGGTQGTLRAVISVSEDLAPDSCSTQHINLPTNLIKRLCSSGINTITISVNDNGTTRRNKAHNGNTISIPLSVIKPVFFDTIEAPYLWCGKYRTESGTYHDTTESPTGCDIISTLQLLVQKKEIVQDTVQPTTGGKVEGQDTATTTTDTLSFPTKIKLNKKRDQQRFVIENLVEGNGYENNTFTVYDNMGKQIFSAENISKGEDFWTPGRNDIRPGKYYWRFIGNGAWGHIDRTGDVTVTR